MPREGSKEFIENEAQWPHWPLLPVVNRHRGSNPRVETEAGLIHRAALTKVRLGNLWDMDQAKWDAAPILEFDSVQALVDAGWEPD